MHDNFQTIATVMLREYEQSRSSGLEKFHAIAQEIHRLYRTPLLGVCRRDRTCGAESELHVQTFLTHVLVEGFARSGRSKAEPRTDGNPNTSLIARYLAAKIGNPHLSFRAYILENFNAYLYEQWRRREGRRETPLPDAHADLVALVHGSAIGAQMSWPNPNPQEECETAEFQAFLTNAAAEAFDKVGRTERNTGFVDALRRAVPEPLVLLRSDFKLAPDLAENLRQSGSLEASSVSSKLSRFKAVLEKEFLGIVRRHLSRELTDCVQRRLRRMR